MGAATIFFWLQLANVSKGYRTALTITGLVTLIATYHYIRIFNSWVDAFEVTNSMGGDYTVKVTGAPFNDACRLQCVVLWHCIHGSCHHLLLAAAGQREQGLPHSLDNHRACHAHCHLPLHQDLQLLG